MDCNVVDVTFSEEHLFYLPDHADNLIRSNQTFREDGVLRFDIHNDGGDRTRLEEICNKFQGYVRGAIKRFNLVSATSSKASFGHVATEAAFLQPEELSAACASILDVLTYCPTEKTCCSDALDTDGIEGLVEHYFNCIVKGSSKKPPLCSTPAPLNQEKKRAKAVGKFFNNVRCKVKSASAASEAAKVVMEFMKESEPNESQVCSCHLCFNSDEVFAEGDDGEWKADPQATAGYYFGKGFYYASGINVPKSLMNRISRNFSLSFLSVLSLNFFLTPSIPGISSPYLYFGLCHSFFPVHIEDLSMWSVNFLHYGAGKVWIVVSPRDVAKLNFFMSRELAQAGHGTCEARLTHKYHFLTPMWLQKFGIKFKVVLQKPGQGILLAPNAAHFGFNMGTNAAEAIGYTSKYWIPYGITYPKCACMGGEVHSDLTSIICNHRPEMLSAYRARIIPAVPDEADFVKRIVYPKIWSEAFVVGASVDDSSDECSEVPESGDDDDADHEKMSQNRKELKCPVCARDFKGGHKSRLLSHVASSHPSLPSEEAERVQTALNVMFPSRGSKLPKKQCFLCGKLVARNMKAHQNSKGCQPCFEFVGSPLADDCEDLVGGK